MSDEPGFRMVFETLSEIEVSNFECIQLQGGSIVCESFRLLKWKLGSFLIRKYNTILSKQPSSRELYELRLILPFQRRNISPFRGVT